MTESVPQLLSIPGYERVELWDQVESTMVNARALIPTLSPSGSALVIAHRQSAGRGRQGRVWVDTPGNFTATFVFPVVNGSTQLSGYSLAVGVGLCKALALGDLESTLRLKWPNDLVVWREERLRKLGGVLIEVVGAHLLVGVGINVKASPDEQPHAICLADLGLDQDALDLSLLRARIATELLAIHNRFISEGGFSHFVEQWKELSCFTDQTLTVSSAESGNGMTVGKYSGVSSTGALLLRGDTETYSVVSGHLLAWH